jgi:virulence factor Mce-like protein
MTAGRLTTNLVAVALASAVLLVYAFSQLLAGALFDRSYPLEVTLPESGGLLAGQEVTVSGRVVGVVRDVRLEGTGVVATLGINEGEQVPVGAQVVVLRRSPVGEQAIDFRPAGMPTAFHQAGDVVDGSQAVTPVAVQRLLSLADEVFEPIDEDSAAALVSTLADAVRGRRDDLRAIITDSARFSEAVADNGQDYDRLFAESRVVSASLARSRETLARSIGEMADAAQVLSDMRGEFEGLLAEAPPALVQVAGLVDRSQANLSCTITHLAELNQFASRPDVMADAEQALRVNQFFFSGFDIIAPRDPSGNPWSRIQFMLPQQPPPTSYLPAKRPIPEILPGGACASPFGQGAPSATQPGYFRTVPDASIVRPADDRTEPVRSTGAPLATATSTTGSTTTGAPAGEPTAAAARGALPATGAAGLGLAGGLLLLGAAGSMLRRRAPDPDEPGR